MEQSQTSKEISCGISSLIPRFFKMVIRQYAINWRQPLTTSLMQSFFLQIIFGQTVQKSTQYALLIFARSRSRTNFYRSTITRVC